MTASLLVLLLAAEPEFRVSSCVPTLTVRSGPALSSPRAGALEARTPLKLNGAVSDTKERIKLTFPGWKGNLAYEPAEPWLDVSLPDGGTAWAWGGALCRPVLFVNAELSHAFVLHGWSAGGKIAFEQRAANSGACDGMPATLRIVDTRDAGAEVFRIDEGCPNGTVLMFRYAAAQAAFDAHGIVTDWFPKARAPAKGEVSPALVAAARKRIKKNELAGDGWPKVTPVAVVENPQTHERVVLIHVMPNEDMRAFEAFVLPAR